MLETNPQGPVRGRQSDAELVADARGAMPPASEAFNELVRRYQRMVYALALSLVRSDDADDVVVEVDDGPVDERLETADFQRLDVHARSGGAS